MTYKPFLNFVLFTIILDFFHIVLSFLSGNMSLETDFFDFIQFVLYTALINIHLKKATYKPIRLLVICLHSLFFQIAPLIEIFSLELFHVILIFLSLYQSFEGVKRSLTEFLCLQLIENRKQLEFYLQNHSFKDILLPLLSLLTNSI